MDYSFASTQWTYGKHADVVIAKVGDQAGTSSNQAATLSNQPFDNGLTSHSVATQFQ